MKPGMPGSMMAGLEASRPDTSAGFGGAAARTEVARFAFFLALLAVFFFFGRFRVLRVFFFGRGEDCVAVTA
jgi:hypothetical protein